jgi:hypothetical protein
MLRYSLKLLTEGVQNTNEANRGFVVTKALSMKTLVVKHDDVNRMFYIQLDNGLVITTVMHFCAKSTTVLPCIQDDILFFGTKLPGYRNYIPLYETHRSTVMFTRFSK